MLVLSRGRNESVICRITPEDMREWMESHPGESLDIEVKMVQTHSEGRARLGFTADTVVQIHREEVWAAILAELVSDT